MERDAIFIGHATPEDNDFTLWLQSKLRNEGYNCECDLSFLIGGEADYWKNIQDFLHHNTIKYIIVVSDITFNKSGVLDEWEHCRSIEREYQLSDFIIPIKIDNSPYNSRIGLNRKNIISFEQNWAVGLKRLLRKLAVDEVPKQGTNVLSLHDWYENVYTNFSGVDYKGQDTFFSNWLKIPSIPEKIYFYKYYNEEQAKLILSSNTIYPAYRHGSIIITFQSSLPNFVVEKNLEINPIETLCKNTKDAFEWYSDKMFPTYHDFRRLLVRLLNECFKVYLIGLGLLKYDLSNSSCFFFEHKEEKTKGRFVVNDKNKNISVTGKYFDDFWHYAISFKTLLYPELCYSIKNHIVFTEDGKKVWPDVRAMHSARRKKGKMMHNKEWRDQFLAFLAALSNTGNNQILIPVAENEALVLSTTPILFNAGFSYIEPNDKERVKSIDGFFEEEDYYEQE